jgi:hypothetical protein
MAGNTVARLHFSHSSHLAEALTLLVYFHSLRSLKYELIAHLSGLCKSACLMRRAALSCSLKVLCGAVSSDLTRKLHSLWNHPPVEEHICSTALIKLRRTGHSSIHYTEVIMLPALAAGLGMIGMGQAINQALTIADMNAKTQKKANETASSAI